MFIWVKNNGMKWNANKERKFTILLFSCLLATSVRRRSLFLFFMILRTDINSLVLIVMTWWHSIILEHEIQRLSFCIKGFLSFIFKETEQNGNKRSRQFKSHCKVNVREIRIWIGHLKVKIWKEFLLNQKLSSNIF